MRFWTSTTFPARGETCLESARRPVTVLLVSEGETVYVRDQHPLDPAALGACLVDLSPEAWYRLLNARVFFWPTRDRLTRMLGAYGQSEQAIFEVDTQGLLEHYAPKTELSHINSGYASKRYPPARRGSQTFVPLPDYVHSARNKVAEVTVLYSVPDIFSFTDACNARATGAGEPGAMAARVNRHV